MTLVPARTMNDIKLYFRMEGLTYNVDKPFEEILRQYRSKELDLKDGLTFAPVVMKGLNWVHAMDPAPATLNWPFVAHHKPFMIEKLDGMYTLEFFGSVMNNRGRFEVGYCSDFEQMIMKLIAPRFVRLKRVDNEKPEKVMRIEIPQF